MNESINYEFHLWNIDFVQHNPQVITQGNALDYLTIFDFIVPFDGNESLIGTEYNWYVPIKGNELDIAWPPGFSKYRVIIGFTKVEDKSRDIIQVYGEAQRFGDPSQYNQGLLPYSVFTDNKGKYPCYRAYMIFPFRIANWLDLKQEPYINFDRYEDFDVLDYVPEKDKLMVIKLLNSFLSEQSTYDLIKIDPKEIVKAKSIKYNDITAMSVSYYLSKDLPNVLGHDIKVEPILIRVLSLASEHAYRNAIAEYYLGTEAQKEIKVLVNKVVEQQQKITNEKEFVETILKVIKDVIKFHVEIRNWVDPFWDNKRKIKVDDKEIEIPAIPKKETSVQPTLYMLLYEALLPLGISVSKETDEGVGILDFKCTYIFNVNNISKQLNIPIEFKLAHHKEIKKGIRNQLPAYCKATKSSYGIFIIMWFKDAKEFFFTEPKGKDKRKTLIWLNTIAEEVKKKENITIIPEIIDASIRPTASNL